MFSLLIESLEIWINGKLIFSRASLGEDPDIAEIVEITRWGHKVGTAASNTSF